jgi:hypothetical protein
MSQISDRPEDVHQHSGWWLPVAILLAILVLGAGFLLYALRPGMGPGGGRTSDSARLTLTVRGLRLEVPANYLDNRSLRSGSEQDVLTLSALLPDLRGYSPADAALFQGNAPDSAVVHLLFKGDENDLNAEGRLERIYRPYIADPAGRPGDYGLTHYEFRADSGYGREDLFAGSVHGRLVLFLCERADAELASPNCLATGRPVAKNLGLSYRFKRAHLARWQQIATGMDGLMARFLHPS